MMRPSQRLSSTPGRVALWIAGFVLVGFLAVCVVGAITLASIASDLRRARTMIDTAGAQIENGQPGPARANLAEAEKLLTDTNNRLYGRLEFDLVDWAPPFDQNLASLRSSVGLALQIVHGGNQLLAVTAPLEDNTGHLVVSMRHGAVPLDTMAQARQEASELVDVLPGQGEEPSSSLLFGPIADLQHTLFAEGVRRREELSSVTRGLDLLADMAGANGPRRYLIAVANPAEMRGAGGMILSYGVLQSNAGTFTLGDFGGIDDLLLDAPPDVSKLNLPADYLQRWNGREPTQLWRNTTLAPDFTFDAPTMEAMFTAKTGLPVDGVIQIDPAGLAAILTGTGPVNVEGLGQVDATNVLDLTINQAYINFPNRDQRQELLGDVARATFRAFIDGDFSSLRPFGDALVDAAQSRHLIFYANSSDVERDVAFFGADGALPGPGAQDYAMLTVQNFSKNKLDYYVDTSLSISGNRPRAAAGALTAQITVTNSAPPTVPSAYIMGPNAPGEVKGLYRGTVSLYVPTGTTLVDSSGSSTPATLTTEAGRTVATYDVQLGPGESSTVTLHLALVPRPAQPYGLLLVPVPRVRPTVESVDVDAGPDGKASRPAAPVATITPVAAGGSP